MTSCPCQDHCCEIVGMGRLPMDINLRTLDLAYFVCISFLKRDLPVAWIAKNKNNIIINDNKLPPIFLQVDLDKKTCLEKKTVEALEKEI